MLSNRIVLIGATLAGMSALFVAWNNTQEKVSTDWVDHTNEVIQHSQQLLTLFVDAETGQRGYLITGSDRYLDPYNHASMALPEQIRTLRQSTLDNPRQQQRLDRLTVVANDKLSELAETIRVYREQGREAAWAIVSTDRGKKDMDEIRSLLAATEGEESRLLVRRKETRRARTAAFVAAGLFLAALLILFAAGHFNQKKAETLQESESQFRTLANTIPHLCWIAHADGWIFWYNQRWYDYTGTTPEQMDGWGWKSVHDQTLLPVVLERWQASIATGNPFEMVFPLLGADGVFRSFLTRVTPVRDKEGKLMRWFGTNTDISEQRKNEEALRSHSLQLETAHANLQRTTDALRISEHTVRSLFETASQGILTADLEGRIVDVNAMALRLFGYPREELIGELVEKLIPERLHGSHVAHRAAYLKEPVSRPMGLGMDLLARRKDGSEFPVEISLSYVAGLSMALISDISLRHQAARDREILIGRLKSSLDDKVALLQEVHHRVKNNLQIICSLLSMQAETVLDPKTNFELGVCRGRVMSMAMIHEQLYAREDMSSVDLADYARELAAELFSASARSGLITYRLDAESIRLTIEQAVPCGLILNELITNALKYAYPEGAGEILIRVWAENDHVSVGVSDHGVGLPVDFDPQVSQSLGLTLVHLLARQLDGEVEIGKRPGASVTIRFTRREPKGHPPAFEVVHERVPGFALDADPRYLN